MEHGAWPPIKGPNCFGGVRPGDDEVNGTRDVGGHCRVFDTQGGWINVRRRPVSAPQPQVTTVNDH